MTKLKVENDFPKNQMTTAHPQRKYFAKIIIRRVLIDNQKMALQSKDWLEIPGGFQK